MFLVQNLAGGCRQDVGQGASHLKGGLELGGPTQDGAPLTVAGRLVPVGRQEASASYMRFCTGWLVSLRHSS